MKFLYHQNQRLVVSRERPGEPVECVDACGRVVRLPAGTRSDHSDPPIVPGVVDFPSRPATFVLDLQRRRLQSLRDHRARRGRVKPSPDRPPTPRQTKGIAEALRGLPADLQALALAKLSKKKGRK